MSRFQERLEALGYARYVDYLASPHWEAFKESYRASGRSFRCAACGAGKVQLHHHTYERLGAEDLADVTPLCRPHHEEVHRLLKESGRFVRDTRWAVGVIGGGRERVAQQPAVRTKKGKKKAKNKRDCHDRRRAILSLREFFAANPKHRQASQLRMWENNAKTATLRKLAARLSPGKWTRKDGKNKSQVREKTKMEMEAEQRQKEWEAAMRDWKPSPFPPLPRR